MAQLLPPAIPSGLWARWTNLAIGSRRVPTVLAPALPALVLLAVTTAGMVDPPTTGLATQLHVAAVTAGSTASVTPAPALPVTAR